MHRIASAAAPRRPHDSMLWRDEVVQDFGTLTPFFWWGMCVPSKTSQNGSDLWINIFLRSNTVPGKHCCQLKGCLETWLYASYGETQLSISYGVA